MQAVRAIIETKSRDFCMRIPDWAIGRKVEVIMLPTSDDQTAAKENTSSLIDHLLLHPLNVSGFSPLSRESVHER